MQEEPIPVGSQRQLFLDDMWFARQENIELTMHPPLPREVALTSDRPWESRSVHWPCVLKDGGLYRMWYHSDEGSQERLTDVWTCYAESRDGIHWDKPNLGLVSRQGSRDNNIVLPAEGVTGEDPTVIVDPNAAPGERYKMIVQTGRGPNRWILGYVSADGLRWRGVETNPLFTEGPFDTQNVLVWDDERERYVIYLRAVGTSRPGPFSIEDNWEDIRGGHRAIRRSESTDFLHWSEPELVISADGDDPADLHLYTNAAVKYYRAARAYLMFPMVLYVERSYAGAPFPGLSDVQFAFSRDGVSWDRRFRQPFISPGLDERNWVDRNPIMGTGVVPTGPDEISMYYSELFRSSVGNCRLRRCTLRTDGFVSVQGPYVGWGDFTTPTLTFSGRRLELNYSTSGGGSVLVELQDGAEKPVPGFTLNDCEEVFGDKIEGIVRWRGGADLNSLSGRPVRLRVRLRDAHLYAFRFSD